MAAFYTPRALLAPRAVRARATSQFAHMLDFSVDVAHWPAAALQQRVAITTGSYDHAVDGVALTLNRLAAHLLRQGHEVGTIAEVFVHNGGVAMVA